MGRPTIGDVAMTPAERQRRARNVTKTVTKLVTEPLVVMTAAERQALLVVMRQREKVAMGDAVEYRATLIANFERKLAAIYKPKDHPVWAEAHAAAKRAGEEAQAKVQATFRQLGIPEAWAPGISVGWYGRGENASAERRAELRRVAVTEADRRMKVAQANIKRQSVAAQERVLVAGLTSEAANTLLEAMPTAALLMPELELDAIEKIAAPDRSRLPTLEDDLEDD